MTAKPGAKAPTAAARLGVIERQLNELAGVLQARDLVVDERISTAQGTAENALNALLKIVDELNKALQMAQAGMSAHDRLTWYEARVPQMHTERKRYDRELAKRVKADQLERARREQLVTEHPEWTDEEKAAVRQTGELPTPDDGAGAEGAEVPPA